MMFRAAAKMTTADERANERRDPAGERESPVTKGARQSRATGGYRIGFALVGMLVLACAVLIPFAIFNLWQVLMSANTDAYRLTAPQFAPGDPYSLVRIEVVALDEAQQIITLRVSGYHACDRDCNYNEKIVFYSLASRTGHSDGLPTSASLTLPANATEANATFQLPFKSDLIRYPFDAARLILGITAERVGPDGAATPLSPDEAAKQLSVEIADQIPRVRLQPPQAIDPATVRPARVKNFDYLAVYTVTFERYLYLKILVVLIVLLIATAAAYAALLRPFDQLILNAGALVLGIYGVRSLVLGSFPNDTTAVDIFLTSVAFFLLCTIAVRGLSYMHLKSGLRLPGLARERATVGTTRVCPECGSEIPRTARRCSFCTSFVEPDNV